ncbi:hypothetical protein KBC40_02260 [Patescibacteria group bacterium]|nr:hypothetical protein [Patescibacteria group bacterium]
MPGSPIKVLADGDDFLLLGSFQQSYSEKWIAKIDFLGNLLWLRNFSFHTYSSYGLDFSVTTDGGYVFAGSNWSVNEGFSSVVLKLDANCEFVWQHTFDNLNKQGFVATIDSAYVLVGGDGLSSLSLIKIGSDGSVIWSRELEVTLWNPFWSMYTVQNSDGTYLIGGSEDGQQVLWLVKVSAFGDLIWERMFNLGDTSLRFNPFSFRQVAEGGVLVVGNIQRIDPYLNRAFIVSTDSIGTVLWSSVFSFGDELPNGFEPYLRDACQLTDGSVVGSGLCHLGAFLIKFGGATPRAVEDLSITTDGIDAHLTWSAVTQLESGEAVTPDAYLVYYSHDSDGEFYFHGFTSTLNYSHHGVSFFSDQMFYRVTAYAGNIGTLETVIQQNPKIKMSQLNQLLHLE